MIRSVHFENFRALRDVKLNLGPFTVLVGPNACGKSSVLSALQGSYAIRPTDRWRGSAAPAVTIELDDKTYVRRTAGDGVPVKSSLVHFDLAQMRSPRIAAEVWSVDGPGAELVNVFATMPRPAQAAVAAQLGRFVPAVKDVHARPSTHGQQRLVFQDRWTDSLWYEPDQVSDGTIYSLGYLVLKYQLERPQLLCIEEPERSLHPYLLGQVVDLLRGISSGELDGEAIQVLVATQSAELLEHVEAADVRFFGRDDDGNVVVRAAPTNEPGWDEAVREYSGSIGQMWLSGGLGGVPTV